MCHPLSASSHRGHLEPTTTRLGYISVVINTVLAQHTHPAGGNQSSSLGSGTPAPSDLGGAQASLVESRGRVS